MNERDYSYMICIRKISEKEAGNTLLQAYDAFAALYDPLMADVDYTAWTDYLLDLLQSGGILPGEPVLDCACGTGEITIRLQKAGYRMTGADLSPRMLEIAQQKARKSGVKITFVRQPMQKICMHKPVSAINCSCDGVNYLLSDADVDAFFTGANHALIDGGLLLFDISSAYKLEHVLGGQTFGEDREDCTYLWQNYYDPKSRLLEMRLAFFTPDGKGAYQRFDERHVQRAHTREEMIAALDRAGFAVIGVYDAFTKNAPTETGERIQFVAKKKSST
jgi:SAM-dependent methyltransferase